MQSSEVRSRSVLVFGAGAVVGAGVTWFIMSATTSRRPSTSSSRQRYGAQLRRILADLELRLTDAVDQLVARLSVSCTTDADHQKLSSSESSRNQLTPRDDQWRPSKSHRLNGVAVTQHQQQVTGDENKRTSADIDSVSATSHFFSQVDRLFNGSAEDRERALEMLKDKEHQLSDDVNFVWRLSKATHYKSKIESQRDKNEEKRLAYLSRDLAARALEIDPNSADAHKWFGVTTGVVGDFESPKVRIQNGLIFKEHVEKAIALNPKDSKNYYLLGRWSYRMYSLSWIERKVASTFFAAIPTVTIDDALDHFLKAEKMNPGMFKENLCFIAKCYIAKKDVKTAVKWLQKAAKVPVISFDDENCQKEVNDLLAKYE